MNNFGFMNNPIIHSHSLEYKTKPSTHVASFCGLDYIWEKYTAYFINLNKIPNHFIFELVSSNMVLRNLEWKRIENLTLERRKRKLKR